MAPKQMDRAYAARDVPIPEARQNDWQEIARFLATTRQLMHSGGLRHAFARLELDAVQRLAGQHAHATGDGTGAFTLRDGADAKNQVSTGWP